MSLVDQLVIEVLQTQRDGARNLRIDYRVFEADGTTLLFHGGRKWADVSMMRPAIVEDRRDVDEAVEIALRSAFSRGSSNIDAAKFDGLAGKRFRVRTGITQI